MIRVRHAAAFVAAACVIDAPVVSAQVLASASTAALAVAAPDETAYDAGASNPTGNYTIATTCTGSGVSGCRLFLQYGTNSQGQQVDMQYAVVSLGSADCQGAVADPTLWLAMQPTSVVLSTAKNKSCVATFRFRVSPLSWSAYQSPGPPGGNYRQQVNFVLTRP
jgi:hypothetical protein